MDQYTGMSGARSAVLGITVAYVGLLAAAGTGLGLAATVRDLPGWVVLASVLALIVALLAAAACAAHAFLRRRWGWGVALLVAWPLAVPVYLSWVLRDLYSSRR